MTTSTPRITVLVADDHPFFRDGVTRGLLQSGVIEVVAQAEDGREALELIREHRPQVALVDYQMPDMDGLDVVHAVVRDALPTRVLLLSAATDSAVVYRALEEGAAGYLSKDARRAEIVDAVQQAAKGRIVVPPALAAGLAGQIRLRAASPAPRCRSSPQRCRCRPRSRRCSPPGKTHPPGTLPPATKPNPPAAAGS